ncbi:MAG TPA: HAD family hydrolase [bacterium]|mgnify:CR=1 FL=1|nr:HAD family hydrolase [bacterium]HQI50264.1 HAD family hydrolase [bacterium]HQJ65027.1 HAD family hydrolase [bacterium]
MYDAILFDLDGTLLELDNDLFVKSYFGAMAPKLAPWYPKGEFMPIILAATEAMMQSRGDRGLLCDVFREVYDRRSPVPFATLEPVYADFYRNEFEAVRVLSRPLPLARDVLKQAVAITPRIALATIPIFPRIAIDARLAWGNLADFPFSLITSFENMHTSKPNPTYYLEIAHHLGVAPGACLMVGNDYRDDMSASAVGMETFLVLDGALNAHLAHQHPPTYTGSLAELHEFLQQLRTS